MLLMWNLTAIRCRTAPERFSFFLHRHNVEKIKESTSSFTDHMILLIQIALPLLTPVINKHIKVKRTAHITPIVFIPSSCHSHKPYMTVIFPPTLHCSLNS